MINIKKIKPIFTKVLTTTERYLSDIYVGNIIQATKGSIKEYQRVVAIGDTVRNVKVGDLVMINPSRYIKKKYDEDSLRNDIVDNPKVSIDIPIVVMDDKDYFLIDENDISYIIEDFEVLPDKKPKKADIIMPKKTKLILN